MSNEIIISELEKRADFFASESLSPATKRAYESDWRRFHDFCVTRSLHDLPSDPETVALYLSWMADSGMRVSTIIRHCTSISAVHDAFGYVSPIRSERVANVISGIKRSCGRPVDQSVAISWSDLKKMVECCGCLMAGIRNRAILSLGWCGALRRSEIVSLDMGDLDFTEYGLIVHIRRSKTDQEGHGRTIGIPRSIDPFCPVKAVENWIERQLESLKSPELPLFTAIGKRGFDKWWSTTGSRLGSRMVSLIVKKYANLAGLPSRKFSAHSLRRGLATEAGSRNVPERIIARHTGHRSITVLRGYIEQGNIWTENPLSAIYRSHSGSLPGSNQDIQF